MSNPVNINSYTLFEDLQDTDKVLFYSQKNGFKPYSVTIGTLRSILANTITADNGLTDNNNTIELGGTLNQDTNIDVNGNTITTTNGNAINVMGQLEIAPSIFVPANGIFLNEGGSLLSLIGQFDFTSVGSTEELALVRLDAANGVANGLVIRRVPDGHLTLSIWRPDGSAQFGFNAFDGTGVIQETADHYAYDPILNLDIALVQTTMSQVDSRYCYDTTPSNEQFNRITLNSSGINVECTGGTTDDKYISIQGFLKDAINDAAAALLGVPIGAMYRNGSILMIRVT